MEQVKGYDRHAVTWEAIAPLLNAAGLVDETEAIRPLSEACEDHLRGGGRLQMSLDTTNVTNADPGFRYEVSLGESSEEGQAILLERTLERDESFHEQWNTWLVEDAPLLDQATTLTLQWHADACGPGPHALVRKPAL